MVTHLLICVIISIGFGLNYDLISAWKSGKNPSASKDMINSIIPVIYVCFYSFFEAGSKTLKIMIPTVIIAPTTIFFTPSFSFLSLTLEHKTPTRMTDIKLHDLNIITTGKLVR